VKQAGRKKQDWGEEGRNFISCL